MPELSIIVPVYKVEPYLPKCIESILAQTFTDFELILIDDGSPDRCGEICDEYASRDSRIVVIHQENQGVSAARNRGLDIARGTYVSFVDSDDYIDFRMYEEMIASARCYLVGLVLCGFRYKDINDRWVADNGNYEKCNDKSATILCANELIASSLGLSHKLFWGACCNKLFARSLVGNLRFDQNLSIFEDFLFFLSLYNKNRDSIRALLLPETFYTYRTDTQNSLTKSINYKKVNNSLNALYKLIPAYKNNRSLWDAAIIRFWDDSVKYLIMIGRDPKTLAFRAQIKLKMIRYLIIAHRKAGISKTTIHKYIYEGVMCA